MLKYAILFVLCFCIACKSKPGKNIAAKLSGDKQSLIISNMEYAALSELQADSSGRLWQSLVPVYKMPADTDLLDYQPVQPGQYIVSGENVIFTPDTPFKTQQPYFVRYYRYKDGMNVLDIAKGSRKLGRMPYTDLIFKY